MQGDITAGPVDNQNGALQKDINSVSKSGTLSLTVVDTTKAKKADGSRLDLITVDPATDATPLPKDTGIVGQVIDFGPDGATFVPPLIMSIHYTDSDIPKGSTEDDLYIGLWDGTKWTALETHIDKTAKVLTTSISHFTDYALLMDLHPVSEVPASTLTPAVIIPTVISVITPTPVISTAMIPFNWAWIVRIAGTIIFILLAYLFWILFIVKKKMSLVFIETSELIKAGLPSKLTIQVLKRNKRPYNVDKATNLKLSSTSITGRFDSNVTGAFDGSVSTVVIPKGSNSVSFYYRDSKIVSVKIEARELPVKGWKRAFINLIETARI